MIRDRLNEVFQEVFDDDTIEITPATTARDIDGWDSLTHVNLIVAVEMRFGIRFNTREVLGFKDVSDLMEAIKSKLAS